jgi:hypothetical protein
MRPEHKTEILSRCRVMTSTLDDGDRYSIRNVGHKFYGNVAMKRLKSYTT